MAIEEGFHLLVVVYFVPASKVEGLNGNDTSDLDSRDVT